MYKWNGETRQEEAEQKPVDELGQRHRVEEVVSSRQADSTHMATWVLEVDAAINSGNKGMKHDKQRNVNKDIDTKESHVFRLGRGNMHLNCRKMQFALACLFSL